MTYPDEWNCPICKTHVRNEERCPNCTYPGLWHCPNCGKRMDSTMVCKECGYNPMNPSKSKKVIKRNQVLTIVVVVYALILAYVVFRIMTQDKITNMGDLLINSDISFVFYSFQKLDSVSFTLTSPSMQDYFYESVSNNANNWAVMNLTLNESGNWIVSVEKTKDGRVTSFSQTFKINSECTRDEHCVAYDDYECNTALGICVQHQPGMFDFLDEIGVKII